MASLGTFILLATFVVAAYAAVASVVGARRGSRGLMESGVGAFYLMTALMTVGSVVMINAFITGDYSIRYVAHNSDSVQPLFYKITSYWGGLDGSIMFWVFLLSVFGTCAVYVNRERHRELIPYVIAVISTVQMFFLYLMVVHKNPFTTTLTNVPAEGEGLNPLLQNFYMAIHPPSLYTGFVGMTIPYAFCMAALITGHLDDSWLRAVRRWTMVSWLFLTLGLTLGMLWAYEELGWGGYWEWDPVENAALLPWFTATAFLHSVMVQERRSMLRIWNVTLVIVTFFLTIFGTFMTRSGIVQSVHAFGQDTILTWLFSGFMVLLLVFSFGLVIWRLPLLRSRNELDSWVSREAAFLANNWIMLFCAFFVLFGTMFPTISEALTGERLTVGAAFFNKWLPPIAMVLLFLTGTGPLLAWRKSTIANIREQFLWPASVAIVTTAVLRGFGIQIWAAGLCFGLCAYVMTTVAQEFWRGGVVRRSTTGTDMVTAIIGMVSRNRRRYGGYIVHVGIVLMALGFTGNGFKLDQQMLLKPGGQTTVGNYTLHLNSIKVNDDGQKQMVTAFVTVFRDGKQIDELYPARWFFRKHEKEPTTEVALRRSFGEDLYVVLGAYDLGKQNASLQIVVNPLVDWIWFGFGVIALGTGIALLPEKAYSFAVAKLPVPEGAATTIAILLAVLLGSGATARAQGHLDASTGLTPDEVRSSYFPRTDFERQMQHEIVCTCGTCGHTNIAECRKDACPVSHQMRSELATLVDEHKTHDEVIQWFVAKYGSEEMLGAPIDTGFNRLVWFLPYLLGVGSAAAVGFVALKWSKRAPGPSPDLQPATDPATTALNDRLDDELRNLD